METKKKKYGIGLIIIPIIIANTHVAVFPFYFVLYLPYIGEYVIYVLSKSNIIKNEKKIKKLNKKLTNCSKEETINLKNEIQQLEETNKLKIEQKEKRDKKAYKIKVTKNDNIKILIIIMIICLFTGFITPLKTTPYTYLIKTMMGNTTKNISEHLPLVLMNNINFMVILVLFITILTFTDVKIRLCDLFMLVGLTFLTFYTKRQETMFILMCGFILNRLVCNLFNKYDAEGIKKIEKKMTELLGMITTISIILILSIFNFKPKAKDKFIDKSNYPVMACDYILSHLDINKIRLYNEYNYGSYLIYRGIPVFIDSRADLYSPEFNKDVNVFTDFLTISGVNKDEIEELLDKYGITHLIMYKDAKLRTFIKQDEEKYEKLYEDNHFCVYERKVS